jgi:hypothetical protein
METERRSESRQGSHPADAVHDRLTSFEYRQGFSDGEAGLPLSHTSEAYLAGYARGRLSAREAATQTTEMR